MCDIAIQTLWLFGVRVPLGSQHLSTVGQSCTAFHCTLQHACKMSASEGVHLLESCTCAAYMCNTYTAHVQIAHLLHAYHLHMWTLALHVGGSVKVFGVRSTSVRRGVWEHAPTPQEQ